MPKNSGKKERLDIFSHAEDVSGSNDPLLDPPLEITAEGGSPRKRARTTSPTVPSLLSTFGHNHTVMASQSAIPEKGSGSCQPPPTRSPYNLRPRKPLFSATRVGSSQKRKRRHSVKFKGAGEDLLPYSASGISEVVQDFDASEVPQRPTGYNLRSRKHVVRPTLASSSQRERQLSVKFKSPKASPSPVSPVLELFDESSVVAKYSESSSSSLHPAMSLSDLQFLSLIGVGAFGTVWFSRLLTNNIACAVKVIIKDPSTHFEREVECMKLVDPSFPFIVQILGHFSDTKHAFLVLEYLGSGNMYDHLKRYRALPESHARLYIAEIACALQHLHDRHIIHGDVKSDNVLLEADGHLKLIDLGCSMVVSINREFHFKKDWYKLGALLFRMVTGELLTSEDPIIPGHLSEDCQNLLQKLLDGNPESRLGGFLNLLGHPWLKWYHPESVQLKLYIPRYIPSSKRLLHLANFDPQYEHPDAQDVRLTNPKDPAFLNSYIPMPDAEKDDSADSTFDQDEDQNNAAQAKLLPMPSSAFLNPSQLPYTRSSFNSVHKMLISKKNVTEMFQV